MTEPNDLYAWIAEGEDSFCAIMIGNKWMPAVGARRELIESMRPAIQHAATVTGQRISLYHFIRAPGSDSVRGNRAPLETVEP